METINRYNKMMYNTGPVTFTDFVNNKYDKVHSQLYTNALQKYLIDHPEHGLYRSSYNFIEIKQPEYWQASYVDIISKHYPHSKRRIWLDEYWSKYQSKMNNTNSSSYLFIDEDTTRDAEVIYINYVAGEVKMRSRFTGVEFTVPFNKVNSETPISADYSLNDTFTIKSGRNK